MTWIRIDSHRINVEEICRYSKAIVDETLSKLRTEIELSSGNSLFVTWTPEQLDELLGKVNQYILKNNA